MSRLMSCPRCRRTFDPVRDEACGDCGLAFMDWYERRAAGPPSNPWGRRKAAPKRSRLWRWAGPALGLAAAAACWLSAPGGPAAPAFAAPPGWRVETGLPSRWRFDSVARLTRGSGVIEIESPVRGLPTRAVLEHLPAVAEEEFPGRRPAVGHPRAVDVAGALGRRVEFAGDAAGRPQRGELIFVSRPGFHLKLTFRSDAAEFDRLRRDWEALLGSIRAAPGALPRRLAAALLAAASLLAAVWLAAGRY